MTARGTSADTVATRSSGGAWATTGVLCVTATVTYLAIAIWLDRLRAFAHIDTIANADAMWYLRGFVDGSGTGTSWGPRSLVHPNVANLVHPLVAGVHRLLTALGAEPTPRLLRLVALGVAPLAGGLEVACCHRLLRARSAYATVQTVLYAALFSTTLFAAVPESFVFTGLGLMLLFWHLDREWQTGRPAPLRTLLIGAGLIGTTVTNALLFGIGVFIYRWRRAETARALRSAATAVAASTALTAAVAFGLAGASGRLNDYVLRFEQLHEAPVLREVADGEIASVNDATDQARRYLRRATREVPAAIAYALVPPPVPAIATGEPDSPLRFTYQRSAIDGRRTVAVLMLVGAALVVVILRRRDPLYGTAIALLVFHWGFHTVFGEELLLYSRHWNVASALLLTALVPATPARPLVRWILIAAACGIAANTAYVIQQMGRSLMAHQSLLAVASGPPPAGAADAVSWRL